MSDINKQIQELSADKRALLARKLINQKKEENHSIPKLQRNDGINDFPLSFVQQRLWFLSQFEKEAATYNGALAIRLKGELNIPVLQKSLDFFIDRHEVLRTVYTVINDQPVQRILPSVKVPLSIEDLTHYEHAEQEEMVRSITVEEEKKYIDMENGPLVRFKLLKLTDSEFVFIFALHHILYDGWSVGIFRKELTEIYNSFLEGKMPDLLELKIQYADFALWQRKKLEGDLFNKQMNYWKKKLGGCVSLLELPAPRPRPRIHTHRGDLIEYSINSVLSESLKELSSINGCTLFMTLLAAFKVLLFRYSNQEDIIIGTPIANRNHSDLENIFGCFVNKLAIRTIVNGNPKFTELMEKVKTSTLEAYDNQDLPFEKIVDELNVTPDISHTPIYQVNFYLDKEEKYNKPLTNLLQEDLNIEANSAKFDLFVLITDTAEGLKIKFNYYSDLFNRSDMEQMVTHYVKILEEVAKNPQQSIENIPLLSEEENKKILYDWNRTYKEYPENKTILDFFCQQAARTPNATALVFKDKKMTYRELDDKSGSLANYLKSLGIGAGSLVGVLFERSFEMVISLYAIMKAGGAYVPLDPSLPSERLKFMLEDAKLSAILTLEKLAVKVPETTTNIISLDAKEKSWNTYSHEICISKISPEDPCYVIFTSGSTGKPKGVVNLHKGLYNRLFWMQEAFKLTNNDVVLQKTPYTFDVSVWEFFWPLMTGASLVIAKPEGHKDSQYLADLIQKHKITTLHFVPSMLGIFLEEPNAIRCKSIQRVICSGEALSKALQDKFFEKLNARLFNLYGPTEASIDVTWFECHRNSDLLTVPIGKPISNIQMYILDRHLQPVPVGVHGELHIAGIGLAKGYLNRDDLTNEKFIKNPFTNDTAARMYKTGDVAYYNCDGTIEYAGRIDFQVKVRGLRIELGEIEAVLNSHPSVNQSVVTVYSECEERKIITAYIKLNPNQKENTTNDILRNFLKEKLPDYMVPGYFIILDEIPVSSNGKADRKALPPPKFERNQSRRIIPPSNAIEKRISDIWCNILKLKEVSIDDNFFDIGGDSLTATLVSRRIDPHLSVIEFFKHPTISELSNYLKTNKTLKKDLLYELTQPVADKNMKVSLICIPYGGAGAITYQALAHALPECYSLYAVELPGHDYSNPDEPLMSIEDVAKKVIIEIKEKIEGRFALYGHCVGGALTTEIARLMELKGISPQAVFLGGSLPNARFPNKFMEFMERVFPKNKFRSKRDLVERLRVMGGETDIQNPKEKEFFIKNLFFDAQEAEDYFTRKINYQGFEALNAPFIFVGGERDRTTVLFEDRHLEWGLFSKKVSYDMIKGAGHFFHKHQAKELANIIDVNLKRITSSTEKSTEEITDTTLTKSAEGTSRLSWKASSFFIVALGQLLSVIGTTLTSFAVGIWMFQKTGAVSEYALLFVSNVLPGILTLPFAGALADRFDRKKIMIISNIIAAFGSFMLIISFLSGMLKPWHVYTAAAIGSVANSILIPAYMAAVTQLIPKRYFGQANGLVQLSLTTGSFLAPLMGSFLLGTIGLSGIFIIDITTFSFAVISLLIIKFPNTLFEKREESFFKEITGGWDFIMKRKSMRALVFFFVITNFFMASSDVLLTPMVLSFASPATLGIISAFSGAGLMIGSLIITLWGGTKRRSLGMIGFVLLAGLSIVIMGLKPLAISVTIGLFFFALFISFIQTHWQSLIQIKVGQELQGRVFSTNQMLAQMMRPLAFFVSGKLADRIFEPAMKEVGILYNTFGALIGTGPGRGMGLIMVCVGTLIMIWAILGLKYKPLYHIEDILPDAILPSFIEGSKDEIQKALDRKLESVSQ